MRLAVAEKERALEAIGHPSGKVAFVDEMGKPKLILAQIRGECKTKKSLKSAQNSILPLREDKFLLWSVSPGRFGVR